MTDIIVPGEDNNTTKIRLDEVLSTKLWTLSTESESSSFHDDVEEDDNIYVSDFSPFGGGVTSNHDLEEQQQPVVDKISDIWFNDSFENWNIDKGESVVEEEEGMIPQICLSSEDSNNNQVDKKIPSDFVPITFSFDSKSSSELAGKSISISSTNSVFESSREEEPNNAISTMLVLENLLDGKHLTSEEDKDEEEEEEECTSLKTFNSTEAQCDGIQNTSGIIGHPPQKDELQMFSREMKKLLNEYLLARAKWKTEMIMEKEKETKKCSSPDENEYHYVELNVKTDSREEVEERNANEDITRENSLREGPPSMNISSRQMIQYNGKASSSSPWGIHNNTQKGSTSFRNYNNNNSKSNAVIRKIPTKSCLSSQKRTSPSPPRATTTTATATLTTTFKLCGDTFCIFAPTPTIQKPTTSKHHQQQQQQQQPMKNVKFGTPSAVVTLFDPNRPTKELTTFSRNSSLLDDSSDEELKEGVGKKDDGRMQKIIEERVNAYKLGR